MLFFIDFHLYELKIKLKIGCLFPKSTLQTLNRTRYDKIITITSTLKVYYIEPGSDSFAFINSLHAFNHLMK
jgi:hypothetical protein